jgi:hypothetical protein
MMAGVPAGAMLSGASGGAQQQKYAEYFPLGGEKLANLGKALSSAKKIGLGLGVGAGLGAGGALAAQGFSKGTQAQYVNTPYGRRPVPAGPNMRMYA